MKLTKKELKRLIETFIGRKSGAPYNIKPDRMYLRDPDAEDLTPSKEDLMQKLEPYKEKALNHPKFKENQYQALKPKLATLFSDTSEKGLASPFMTAKAFGVLPKEDHEEVKKTISDIKFLKKAKEIEGPEFGPGKYRNDPGSIVAPSYAAYKAQRDDPGFEELLVKRTKAIIGNPLSFYLEAYDNNKINVHDGKYQVVNDIAKYVIEKLAKKYKIYRYAQRAASLPGPTRTGLMKDYFDPEDIDKIVKRILRDNINMTQIADDYHSMLEVYSEYLDKTNLDEVIAGMILNIHGDVYVSDFLEKLKAKGYDEQFFKDSFVSPEGKLLFPQFNIKDYNRVMRYFIGDAIVKSGDDVFLDGNILFRA